MTDHYSDMELIQKVKEKIASADKVLIGLGEEWKRGKSDDKDNQYHKHFLFLEYTLQYVQDHK